MLEFLVAAVIAEVLFAILVMVVIYRAMGNLVDWVILTFGNAEAVGRLKRDRGGNPDDPESGPPD